jgi:hypothetical protein
LSQILKGTDHFADSGIDERIILKWLLNSRGEFVSLIQNRVNKVQ